MKLTALENAIGLARAIKKTDEDMLVQLAQAYALIAIAEQLRSTNAQLGAISAILDDAIRAYLEEPCDSHPADEVERADDGIFYYEDKA